MRPCFGLAEQVGAALRAEAAVHDIAAFRDAAVILQLAFDREGFCLETGVYGAATGADVLADPAPAHAGGNRRGRAGVAHRSAQAAASDVHLENPRAGGRPEEQ